MTEKFSFKEIDTEGMETLEVISEAEKLNDWMYQTIAPYLHGDILEVGSGIGNISMHFYNDGKSLQTSDIRQNYCDYLDQKFSSYTNHKPSMILDIAHPEFDTVYPEQLGKYDSIFALNVVEHIEEHELAIKNCKKLLKKDGKLLILVPAFQFLYNKFDEELFHYRRYNHKNLKNLLANSGLEINKTFYFNCAGILGWYVSGSVMKNKMIPKGQMQMYNMLVPIFKMVDKVVLNKLGLSVVCVGKKND